MGEILKYMPTEAGRQSGLNYGRWVAELISQDPKTNTSVVKFKLQYKENYNYSSYNVYGQVIIDGETVINFNSPATTWGTPVHGQWDTPWDYEVTVQHDKNGEGSVRFNTNVYMRHTYAAGQYVFLYTYSGAETVIPLPKIDVAAPAYIGGAEYDIYIGNGTAFERYEPLIADGTEFK